MAVLQCLICRVEGRLCAIPLHHVSEIMRPLIVDAVDGAPSFVAGATVLRGEVVPVVNAARLLDSEGKAFGSGAEHRRFVALRLERRAVLLAVTDVIGTRAVRVDELAKTPPLLAAAASTRSSLGLLDGELLEVLDSARIIERVGDAAVAAAVPDAEVNA